MIKLAHHAYLEKDYICYEYWKKPVGESSNTAFYWFRLIELQLHLFLFIRSIYEKKFDLFVRTIDTMHSKAFALDHINCARWVSVFIYDVKSFYAKDVYNEFCKGHITVKKSNRSFFSIGEDHTHEQNNKIIKGDSGAI